MMTTTIKADYSGAFNIIDWPRTSATQLHQCEKHEGLNSQPSTNIRANTILPWIRLYIAPPSSPFEGLNERNAMYINPGTMAIKITSSEVNVGQYWVLYGNMNNW